VLSPPESESQTNPRLPIHLCHLSLLYTPATASAPTGAVAASTADVKTTGKGPWLRHKDHLVTPAAASAVTKKDSSSTHSLGLLFLQEPWTVHPLPGLWLRVLCREGGRFFSGGVADAGTVVAVVLNRFTYLVWFRFCLLTPSNQSPQLRWQIKRNELSLSVSVVDNLISL